MLKRCYHLLITLLITVCAHTVIAGEHVTFDSATSDNHAITALTFSEENTNVIDSNTDDEGSVLNDNLGPYFLSTSRRIIEDGHGSAVNTAPDYFLLIAFLTPKLLDVAMEPSPLISPQSHWTSSARYASSRLSGWKEANTLYVQKHARQS